MEEEKKDDGMVNPLVENPEDICTECGHKRKFHFIDDGWSSCSVDNWSCNCGYNTGR